MFSVVVSVVCFLCYCCHRTLKRRDIVYQQRWVHVDPNMDIYSVEQVNIRTQDHISRNETNLVELRSMVYTHDIRLTIRIEFINSKKIVFC